jgi:hypothetical protein
MNEPAKALAVPMLKKDVDDVLPREQKDSDAVRAQDNRLDRLMTNITKTTLGVLGFGLAGIGFGLSRRMPSSASN